MPNAGISGLVKPWSRANGLMVEWCWMHVSLQALPIPVRRWGGNNQQHGATAVVHWLSISFSVGAKSWHGKAETCAGQTVLPSKLFEIWNIHDSQGQHKAEPKWFEHQNTHSRAKEVCQSFDWTLHGWQLWGKRWQWAEKGEKGQPGDKTAVCSIHSGRNSNIECMFSVEKDAVLSCLLMQVERTSSSTMVVVQQLQWWWKQFWRKHLKWHTWSWWWLEPVFMLESTSWVSWSLLRWWYSWSWDQSHGETAGCHGGSKSNMQHGQWDGNIDCLSNLPCRWHTTYWVVK